MKNEKKAQSRWRSRHGQMAQPGAFGTGSMGRRPSTAAASHEFFKRRAKPAICRAFQVAATGDGRPPGPFSRPGLAAGSRSTRLNRMSVKGIVEICKNANFRAVHRGRDCPHNSLQERKKHTKKPRHFLCPMNRGKRAKIPIFSQSPWWRFLHKSLEAREKRTQPTWPWFCQMNCSKNLKIAKMPKFVQSHRRKARPHPGLLPRRQRWGETQSNPNQIELGFDGVSPYRARTAGRRVPSRGAPQPPVPPPPRGMKIFSNFFQKFIDGMTI